MVETPLIYKGNANIYLQGLGALEPITTQSNLMEYFVAYPESKILVRDFRKNVAELANKILEGDNANFPEIFSQPAWIEIRSTKDAAEILIKDGINENHEKTLWLGVIRDSKMSVQDVDWEIIKSVNDNEFAFAALVY